jgi:hypothetical protein
MPFTALARRDPCEHGAGHAGKSSGFASPETKADDQQRGEIPSERREAGEEGPCGDDSREDGARAEAVGEDAGRRLQQGVAEGEGGEDPPELGIGEAEFGDDRGFRGRDTDAVDVEQKRQKERGGNDEGAAGKHGVRRTKRPDAG